MVLLALVGVRAPPMPELGDQLLPWQSVEYVLARNIQLRITGTKASIIKQQLIYGSKYVETGATLSFAGYDAHCQLKC